MISSSIRAWKRRTTPRVFVSQIPGGCLEGVDSGKPKPVDGIFGNSTSFFGIAGMNGRRCISSRSEMDAMTAVGGGADKSLR
jgi:hypothetical protein